MGLVRRLARLLRLVSHDDETQRTERHAVLDRARAEIGASRDARRQRELELRLAIRARR